MKYPAFVLALACAATAAHTQNATPDLRGTWTGKGKSIVYGHNPHHPGSHTVVSPARVRDLEFTFKVVGLEGRLVWGQNLSKAAATNEPFAWAFAADGKTIIGADTDGNCNMSVQSADLIEMCYAHNGLSPTAAIVATGFMLNRQK